MDKWNEQPLRLPFESEVSVTCEIASEEPSFYISDASEKEYKEFIRGKRSYLDSMDFMTGCYIDNDIINGRVIHHPKMVIEEWVSKSFAIDQALKELCIDDKDVIIYMTALEIEHIVCDIKNNKKIKLPIHEFLPDFTEKLLYS